MPFAQSTTKKILFCRPASFPVAQHHCAGSDFTGFSSIRDGWSSVWLNLRRTKRSLSILNRLIPAHPVPALIPSVIILPSVIVLTVPTFRNGPALLLLRCSLLGSRATKPELAPSSKTTGTKIGFQDKSSNELTATDTIDDKRLSLPAVVAKLERISPATWISGKIEQNE